VSEHHGTTRIRHPTAAGVLAAIALAGCGGGGGGRPQAAVRPPPPATVVAERAAGPRLLDLRVRSRALGRVGSVRLLLPAGWSRRTHRTWPVLYLLHGCCDTYQSWSRYGRVARLGALRDVLVVMPEGGDIGFYSDWKGAPRTRWETFHTSELPALLQRRYHAGTRRAVAGLSMGGLGAMAYAARHPGLFRAAASFSGALHPRTDARWWSGLFAQYETADTVWGDPVADRATWAVHDPTSLAGRLRGVRLYVAAGDGGAGDQIERVVGRESRAFVARARGLGVPVRTDLYAGGRHDWPYWRRELQRALPTLLAPLRT
jgi:S-formylglutathione hydrolase FrmB